MHDLPDNDLKGLIIQVTGCAKDARTLSYTLSCIKNLKKFANFDESIEEAIDEPEFEEVYEDVVQLPQVANQQQDVGLNLSYTINLNLPSTSDIAVFDAIFKSLRQNLLKK